MERTDIRSVVEMAVEEIRTNPPSPVVNTVTLSNYLVVKGDAGAAYQLSETICSEVSKDPDKHPDIIVDLSMFSENQCLFQHTARQIDAGIITAEVRECSALQVQSNSTDALEAGFLTIGLPSVRFPEAASIASLSAIAGRLLTSLCSDTVLFTDELIGPHMVFSDFERLQFVGRYFIQLQESTKPTELIGFMEKIHRVVQSGLWIMKVSGNTMKNILNAMDLHRISPSMLNTSWLIYDESLNPNQCQLLCYTDSGGKTRCGLQKNSKEFLCLKLDLNKADLAALARVKNRVARTWDDPRLNQLDVTFAYEAIRTAVIAYDEVSRKGNWPPKRTAEPGTTLCQMSTPNLTKDTRYYRFADTVRKLPARAGSVGEIIFNGSVINTNARMRLFRCKISGEMGTQQCIDVNFTYSYMTNEMNGISEFPELSNRQALRVLVIHDPPFVVKTQNGWTGYSVEVFERIAKDMDLSYTFVEQENEIYGVKLPDGQWNGMIGEIASKHADIGLGPIIQDGERKMAVDFTIPYYDSAGLTMLISENSDQTLGPFFFLEVFTTPVWICCIICLVVVSLLVYILDKFSPYSYQNQAVRTDGPSEGTIFTLKESVWYVLGACTQQGESLDPRSMSTRILITGHWIFVVIMISMFSANLSARLTVSGLKEEIKSLEQLAVQTDVRYTVRNNSAEYAFFRKMYEIEESLFRIWRDLSMNMTESTSNYSVWQYPITERYGIIFKRMNEWGFTTSTADSLRRVRSGSVVFMESPLAAYHIASSCDLKQLGERIGSWHYGIALAPKSFLTPHFNTIILHMKSENELEKLEKKWWSTNVTNCPETSSSSGFTIDQVGGMFILLACGFVLGGIILVIELIVFRVVIRRAEKKAQSAVTQEAPNIEKPPQSHIPTPLPEGNSGEQHENGASHERIVPIGHNEMDHIQPGVKAPN
ncbi:Glutamate receptor 4 [Fasciola hepatica]|uniref:Glutamate receptor 4 n=1 Tax=Fasciola hepatica TaxID=6192 RepID=A0A4E0RM17_FASHE|nr:Glutamate receptor 4 [Fasciola hepatica]